MVKVQNLPSVKQLIINKKKIKYEKNRKRIFLPKWAVGRPWLRDEANRMVCKIKIKIGQVDSDLDE